MADEIKIEMFDPIRPRLERVRPELLEPYQIEEAAEGPDLRAHWRTIQKRRWTVFSIVLVTFTITLLVTLKEKSVYRADALLEIQKENANIPTVQELFQLENVSDNYLETQYKVLQSETLARRVIDQLHLEREREFNKPKGEFFQTEAHAAASQDSVIDPDTQQTVLKEFKDRLSVDPVRRSRLVQISFESQDPKTAAEVVNSLTDNYIQENLESRWQSAQKASEWLSQQLESFKAKLEKSEDDLQSYAQKNGLLFLETEKGDTENIVNERLRQLQDELTKAQAERYAKESVYRLTEAGDYSALPGVVDNKLMQELTARLAELERQKDALSTTFTDDYPKVKQLQSQIDGIERRLDEERKRAAQGIVDGYLAATRREDLVRQAFEQQQSQANLVAERAVQYNILKREVDTNKQLYEGLLQRLKEAGVSAGMNASNIRVVDAAVPPTRPVRPRPFLNLGLALVLGLGCGIGIAFLQEHLDNTLKNSDDVERILRVPALALIPSRESLDDARHECLRAAGKRRGAFEWKWKREDASAGEASGEALDSNRRKWCAAYGVVGGVSRASHVRAAFGSGAPAAFVDVCERGAGRRQDHSRQQPVDFVGAAWEAGAADRWRHAASLRAPAFPCRGRVRRAGHVFDRGRRLARSGAADGSGWARLPGLWTGTAESERVAIVRPDAAADHGGHGGVSVRADRRAAAAQCDRWADSGHDGGRGDSGGAWWIHSAGAGAAGAIARAGRGRAADRSGAERRGCTAQRVLPELLPLRCARREQRADREELTRLLL